jgi:uncharacterized membrane protein YdjX (TVP38/TMEM64 family)
MLHSNRIFPPFAKSPALSVGLKLAGLLVLIVGVVGLIRAIDVESMLRPERIAEWLGETGPLAPLALIGLMAVAVVISPIPSLPLDMAAGAVFGPFWGATYAVLGAEIGAIISFMIGRVLGQEVLTRMLRFNIAFCEGCSDRHLAIFVFVSRLLPIFSFDLISYGAGLTNISLRIFALVTFLGMIPPTLALTYAGSSITSNQWLPIVLGLGMVVLLLLIPHLVKRFPHSRLMNLLRGGKVGNASSPTSSPSHIGPTPNIPDRCAGCQKPAHEFRSSLDESNLK